MAWEATGGCWEQTLPCSNLYAAVGGTCDVGIEGACQGQVTAHIQCWVHLTCVEYMCVVCDAHMVLLVIAALVICVCYMCVYLVLGAHLCCQCLLHL